MIYMTMACKPESTKERHFDAKSSIPSLQIDDALPKEITVALPNGG